MLRGAGRDHGYAGVRSTPEHFTFTFTLPLVFRLTSLLHGSRWCSGRCACHKSGISRFDPPKREHGLYHVSPWQMHRVKGRGKYQPGYCLGRTPPPPFGGGGQRPKKVCVPKIGLKFPAPLINSIFCRRTVCSDAGGWVGGSAGAGQGPKQAPPPPPGSLSNGLVPADQTMTRDARCMGCAVALLCAHLRIRRYARRRAKRMRLDEDGCDTCPEQRLGGLSFQERERKGSVNGSRPIGAESCRQRNQPWRHATPPPNPNPSVDKQSG